MALLPSIEPARGTGSGRSRVFCNVVLLGCSELGQERNSRHTSLFTEGSFIIPPHQSTHVGPITYSPKAAVAEHCVFFVKNNLTFVDAVDVYGEGGEGRLVFKVCAVQGNGCVPGGWGAAALQDSQDCRTREDECCIVLHVRKTTHCVVHGSTGGNALKASKLIVTFHGA